MAAINIGELKDAELAKLIEARWTSSEEVFSIVEKAYNKNTILYDSDTQGDRIPDYLRRIPANKPRVRANRIFVNTEAVINSLIANPPKPNFIPARNTPTSVRLAQIQEKFFLRRYDDRNMKETLRKGLRNLFFARLIVIKIFWNPAIDDYDVVAVDPRKLRVSSNCTKEEESEFAIEEVDCSLCDMLDRFPDKKKDIMEKAGYVTEEQAYIENPKMTYKESWIGDYLICKYQNIVLSKMRNPYYDWDGLIMTKDEEDRLSQVDGDSYRNIIRQAKEEQAWRRSQSDIFGKPSYFFNHFSHPRKPYIFATVLNNENKPIGRTSFIEEAASLQENVDRRKQQIHDNADIMNGLLKIDSQVVSSKAEAQKIRRDIAAGFIWGKGVKEGVGIDTGAALPQFVFDDMTDSRSEIDNIMAASSAFRGEREGQETKAGRLALIQQSALRLNELVQVVDYVCYELFNWMYHLAKVKYTETHYAKELGENQAVEIISLQQDDFQDGTEINIIPGKTMPEDKEFKYLRAQADVAGGIISPVDYLKEAGYSDPLETAQNAVRYKLNPVAAVGLAPEEVAGLVPPQPEPQPEPEPTPQIPFKDLPADGKIQMAQKAGLNLNPEILAQEMAVRNQPKVK